jgi:hypothetical protein
LSKRCSASISSRHAIGALSAPPDADAFPVRTMGFIAGVADIFINIEADLEAAVEPPDLGGRLGRMRACWTPLKTGVFDQESPASGMGDAGDRGWRGNRDFSTATSD